MNSRVCHGREKERDRRGACRIKQTGKVSFIQKFQYIRNLSGRKRILLLDLGEMNWKTKKSLTFEPVPRKF